MNLRELYRGQTLKKQDIKDNFNNYCELVEKLEKYQINYEKELTAIEEFEESLKKIRLIQASQKKLYEKSDLFVSCIFDASFSLFMWQRKSGRGF